MCSGSLRVAVPLSLGVLGACAPSPAPLDGARDTSLDATTVLDASFTSDASSHDADLDHSSCLGPRGAPPSCEIPDAQTGSIVFERCVIDTAYRHEGAGLFDVDGDAVRDVVTDQAWYRSPDFTRHPIREPQAWSPFGAYALGFGAYPMDVDRDGCVDVVVPPLPGQPLSWYEHPCTCALDAPWAAHVVQPVGTVGLETPLLLDLFEDGRPVLITSDYATGVFGLAEPGADPRATWPIRSLAPAGFAGARLFAHGSGAGDLDGDGDLDVLSGWGWFENPGTREGDFLAHVASRPFAAVENDCSDMASLDVDADGDADLLCPSPHGVGMSWLEQVRGAGEPTFVVHPIAEAADVGEMHAMRLADLDGDGRAEIVSGTRWCAHCGPGDTDDPAGARVVYFTLAPGPTPRFERFVIDDASGIGVAFDIADVDADGDLDLVTANKRGLFVFRRRS